MRFSEKNVDPSRIDLEDDTFRITTEQNIDDLMVSIKHLGLLNLPVLLEQEKGYSIISGFRRIKACRCLNWGELRTRILDSDTEKRNCVKYAIADNSFQRPLNIIEKSKCFMMLSAFYKDIDSLSEILPALGIYEHPSMIKKIRSVYDMPESLRNSILTNTITLVMALELAELAMHDTEGFIRLFSTLKLSLNKQREILTMVKEIAIREGIPAIQVLETPQLNDILENKDLDKNLKAYKIRIYLKQRRFPALSAAEHSFQKHLKKLNLINGMELIPPANFEGSTYTLKLKFNHLKELKNLQSTLDVFVENPHLKKIIHG